MAKMNLGDERRHCEQAYEKWYFVKRIVELYAEGVSWKGCDKIEVDSIENGVRDMLVTGTGEFNLKTPGGAQVLSIPMPKKYFLEDEQPGHPFLWPVTQNTKHLDDIEKVIGPKVYGNEMFEILAKDICLGLGVPYELLGPLSATADGDAIMWGLTTFRGNIKTWRDYLGSRLGLSWNEDWYQSGFLSGYGPVYQAFKAQGIDLRTLRDQVLNAAKSARDGSLISRQTYEESVRWFLED